MPELRISVSEPFGLVSSVDSAELDGGMVFHLKLNVPDEGAELQAASGREGGLHPTDTRELCPHCGREMGHVVEVDGLTGRDLGRELLHLGTDSRQLTAASYCTSTSGGDADA